MDDKKKQSKKVTHVGEYDTDGEFYHDTIYGSCLELRVAWLKFARCVIRHIKKDIDKWMQKKWMQKKWQR